MFHVWQHRYGARPTIQLAWCTHTMHLVCTHSKFLESIPIANWFLWKSRCKFSGEIDLIDWSKCFDGEHSTLKKWLMLSFKGWVVCGVKIVGVILFVISTKLPPDLNSLDIRVIDYQTLASPNWPLNAWQMLHVFRILLFYWPYQAVYHITTGASSQQKSCVCTQVSFRSSSLLLGLCMIEEDATSKSFVFGLVVVFRKHSRLWTCWPPWRCWSLIRCCSIPATFCISEKFRKKFQLCQVKCVNFHWHNYDLYDVVLSYVAPLCTGLPP